jgi:hypothetical protein
VSFNGSTDHQVVAAPNLDAARKAIGIDTVLRYTQLYPNLNHIFQESTSGSTEDYGNIPQTMAPPTRRSATAFAKLAQDSNAR